MSGNLLGVCGGQKSAFGAVPTEPGADPNEFDGNRLFVRKRPPINPKYARNPAKSPYPHTFQVRQVWCGFGEYWWQQQGCSGAARGRWRGTSYRVPVCAQKHTATPQMGANLCQTVVPTHILCVPSLVWLWQVLVAATEGQRRRAGSLLGAPPNECAENTRLCTKAHPYPPDVHQTLPHCGADTHSMCAKFGPVWVGQLVFVVPIAGCLCRHYAG